MNKTAKDYRDLAIEAEEMCRQEMLKEFFELNEKVIKRLKCLGNTGMDEEAWIRLEGVKVDEGMEECYETISKWEVLKLRKKLRNLKEDNIVSEFSDIELKGWSSINEFMKMNELWFEISESDDALMYLRR